MKKLLFAMLWSCAAASQNFVPDTSFDNDGIFTNPSLSSTIPFDILFEDGHYIVPCHNGKIVSVNESGSLNVSYGSQGITTISVSDETFYMSGFFRASSYFYAVGYKTSSDLNDTTVDVVVARLTANGTLDATFGTDGIARIDLGGNDVANAIVEHDGALFVLGTRNTPSESKIFLLKLTQAGLPDTLYAPQGFKTFNVLDSRSYGRKIVSYEDGLLLVCSSISGATNPNLVLIHVDHSGNLVTTFGTGGVKSIGLVQGTASLSVDGAEIAANGKLYIAARVSSSFSATSETLKCINMATGAVEQTAGTYYYWPYFKILQDGSIMTTGSKSCLNTPCGHGFELQKILASFQNDTSFGNAGNFKFVGFSPYGYGEYQSSAFYVHDDGRIAIAGSLFSPYTASANGFGMLRIGAASLHVQDELLTNMALTPIPAFSYFEIRLPDNIGLEKVEVYNMQGRCVRSYGSLPRYSVAGLSDGMYIVRASGTSGIWNARLLVLAKR